MAQLTVICDTREQRPLELGNEVEVVRSALYTGDYSLQRLEDRVVIERKSLPDFVSCCGPERERFCHELRRMAGYDCKAVLVEGTVEDIMQHRYRAQTHPNAVLGSLCSWTIRYRIPFLLCGTHEHAATVCLALLRSYHKQLSELVEVIGRPEF